MSLSPDLIEPDASMAAIVDGDDAIVRIDDAAADLVMRRGRVVLAVSGGVDSMVLLHAIASHARESIAAVATFDHRSGPHSADAAAFVRRQADALAVPVIVGRAEEPLHGEAAWRAHRWRFLEETSRQFDAPVVTAHNRDDAVETVCMRAMRGAGARGLAALFAVSPVERPLLDVDRATIVAYAQAHAVTWLDDPSNASPHHLRNRLRRDLLPAIARLDPSFSDSMLALARRAAEWRTSVEAMAARIDARLENTGAFHVAADAVERYDATELGVLWPALAARGGIRLDRRGTRRLAEFTKSSKVGSRIQLSGGFDAARTRDSFILHRTGRGHFSDSARVTMLADGARFGPWRFARVDTPFDDEAWSAALPADAELLVRRWHPGDRMQVAANRPARRVKRFLSEASIPVSARSRWPVVTADGEIVWVPGVCRSDAASVRSGRPELRYACEPDGS